MIEAVAATNSNTTASIVAFGCLVFMLGILPKWDKAKWLVTGQRVVANGQCTAIEDLSPLPILFHPRSAGRQGQRALWGIVVI